MYSLCIFKEKGKMLEGVTPKVLYEGPTKLIVNEPQKEQDQG
jgi:hypothetical protein